MNECSSSPFCLDKTINLPTILTILKSLVVVCACAFALYDRLVDAEAQAKANALEIAAIKQDVATFKRVEMVVLRVEQRQKTQDGRIDAIYQILSSKFGGK